MVVIRRKQVVLISLVVLVFIAGYLNWSYEKNNELLPVSEEVETGFNTVDIEALEEINLEEEEVASSDNESDNSFEVISEEVFNEQNDYFTIAKISREEARSESVYLLNQMVENESISKEAREKAQNEMIMIADIIVKESAIENLIIAKGFEDAVVFINKDFDVSVVVNPKTLNDSKVAQIMDIVISELNIKSNKIKIMEKI